MKILHVAPSIERAYGGPTQSLAGYVAAARLAGSGIHVAAPAASQVETHMLEKAGASSVIAFRGYGSGSTAASPALVQWVAKNARSYDVIHVHGLFNFISALGARAAISSGIPVVIRPFGTLSRYTFGHRRSGLKRPWFRLVEAPNLTRAAALHFTTDTERDEAAWHGLDLAGKSHVVPPPFVAGASRYVHACARNPDSALFIGRLHPVKNLETLIDAWAIVCKSLPGATLTIAGAGTGAYMDRLRQRAGKHGCAGRISFTGFISGEAKEKALASASVFILPSLHENFGMVVLEAIAAGLPTVISEHVQLRDFVAANDLGIIAGESADSLAAAIVRAAGDKLLQDRVAVYGKRLVEETYAPAAVGERLSAMYLAAVKRHTSKTTDI